MPKVSVIIPFNNVESYISQCLDTVVNQTLKDIEIILINDASTDNSRKIVQQYAEKDSRIKIIDVQERNGQGYARNRGIEIAAGDYIGFVDSDDFIENNMFEHLYNKAVSTDSDITMCQVDEYDDINQKFSTSDYYMLSILSGFENDDFTVEDTKDFLLDINVALWNKVYKKSFLLGTKEKFPEGFIYEDLPFFFGTYLKAGKLNIVWEILYHYRINRKNSTMQQFNNKILDRLPMVSLTYEKFKDLSFFEDIKKKIQGWIINDLFHRYTLLKENYHKDFFFYIKKTFQNLNIENREDEYWKKVYHFQGYTLVMDNTFENFNQKVFTEYLDLHKMEDRLRSEMPSIIDIDRRFGLLYEDLSKVYKYAEKLNSDLKNEVEALTNEKISASYKYTDDKISNIYDDITKIYDYTNLKNEKQKQELTNLIENNTNYVTSQTDEKIANVYDDITKTYDYTNLKNEEQKQELTNLIENNTNYVTSQTDEKIANVYDELSKTYTYTNEKGEEIYNRINNATREKTEFLYNDIKDLSYIIENNFYEINEEKQHLIDKTNDIINRLEENKSNISNVQNQYNEQLKNQYNKVTEIINSTEKELQNSINNIVEKVEEEQKRIDNKILEIKSEFNKEIENQKKNHQEEILKLQSDMKELEIKLREEMKSPIKKLIEKYGQKVKK